MDWRPISANSHITEPPNCYVDHIDPAWRDKAPHVVYKEGMGDIYVVEGMKTPVPMGLIAAAGVDPKDIRIGGAKFDDLHRGGWDPTDAPRRPGQGRRRRRGHLSHASACCSAIIPTSTTRRPASTPTTAGCRPTVSHDPERLIGMGQTCHAHDQGRHRGPRAHQGDGFSRRHDAGQSRREGLRRSRVSIRSGRRRSRSSCRSASTS